MLAFTFAASVAVLALKMFIPELARVLKLTLTVPDAVL